MTGSEKYTWGVILSVSGGVAVSGGIILSATLIGACLGVPMALVGLPLMIWGAIWAYQGHFQRQQEVISAGIREGIASMQLANMSPVSPVIAASGTSAVPAPLIQNSANSIPPEPALLEPAKAPSVGGPTSDFADSWEMAEEGDLSTTELDHGVKDDASEEGEALPS